MSQHISRRSMLGLAAGSALSVVVSQSLLGCAGDGVTQSSSTSSDSTGTTTSPSCVLTAALTEGPYFVDEKLYRSDIRSDPVTGEVANGVLLGLTFKVSRVANSACTPLTGAYLDVWHCNAGGAYSDVSGAGAGEKFLRGYQITDASGAAQFTTIYPGWYTGRAIHVHFKLRLFAGATASYAFTSQFFFDDALTDSVYTLSPYNTRGTRDVRNTADSIYNSLSSSEKAALTLQTSVASGGYSGVINLGVQVG
jgi:protocatechuate 3,4-dioxygenase beta subunit